MRDRDVAALQATMERLDREEAEAVGPPTKADIPAADAVRYLQSLGRTWRLGGEGQGRGAVVRALLERVDALGFREMVLHLTPEAVAHGFHMAVPERLDLTVGYGRGERDCVVKTQRPAGDLDLSLSRFGEDEVKDLLRSLEVREKRERQEALDLDAALDEARRAPRAKPGDLWRLGDQRLLCGNAANAEDVARLLDGAAPTLLTTDPPYGVSLDGSWRDGVYNALGSAEATYMRVGGRVDWSEAFALVPSLTSARSHYGARTRAHSPEPCPRRSTGHPRSRRQVGIARTMPKGAAAALGVLPTQVVDGRPADRRLSGE